MSQGLFSHKKALSIFGLTADQLPEILAARDLTDADLPSFARSGGRILKSWSVQDLPALGEKIGFMPKPETSLAVSVFVTKGGVLKSSLTLNLARMAALHGMKVCVVGLDMQGDITANLNLDDTGESHADLETSAAEIEANPATSTISPPSAAENKVTSPVANEFSKAIAKIDATRGLANLYSGECSLESLILPTDLPTLFYIPETPELVAMEQSLVHRNRREYWLTEKVVKPLKQNFDLILMDCSPNWNRLITNALVACDILITPLECKINNFRNFRAFSALLSEFREDLQTHFEQIYVPTRLASGRKLSQEIYQWYRDELEECIACAVRESLQGEEAVALKLSIPEHAPGSAAGAEMIEVLREIWMRVLSDSKNLQAPQARTVSTAFEWQNSATVSYEAAPN